MIPDNWTFWYESLYKLIFFLNCKLQTNYQLPKLNYRSGLIINRYIKKFNSSTVLYLLQNLFSYLDCKGLEIPHCKYIFIMWKLVDWHFQMNLAANVIKSLVVGRCSALLSILHAWFVVRECRKVAGRFLEMQACSLLRCIKFMPLQNVLLENLIFFFIHSDSFFIIYFHVIIYSIFCHFNRNWNNINSS